MSEMNNTVSMPSTSRNARFSSAAENHSDSSSDDSFHSLDYDFPAHGANSPTPENFSSQPISQNSPRNSVRRRHNRSTNQNRRRNFRPSHSGGATHQAGKYAIVRPNLVESLKRIDLDSCKRLYIRLRKKYIIANKNIYFNRTCLKEGLDPAYVTLHTKNNSPSARKTVASARIRTEDEFVNSKPVSKLYPIYS